MSIQSDLVTAVEALGPAYAAAVAGISARQADQLKDAIARRLAASGATAVISDPNVKRLGLKATAGGRHGLTDFSAQNFSDAVTALVS